MRWRTLSVNFVAAAQLRTCAVLIGGGIAEAGDELFTPLAAALDRFEWRPYGNPVPILRARLGVWAGAAGAVAGLPI